MNIVYKIKSRLAQSVSPTFQVIIGPPSQLTRLTGKLILDDLIVFACGADPTAAHLALPNHLHAERPDINDEGSQTS